MPENTTDHAAEAERALNVIDGVHGSDLSLDEMIEAAHVRATLALVGAQREANEQARIANRLTLAQIYRAPYTESFDYVTINEIREALS